MSDTLDEWGAEDDATEAPEAAVMNPFETTESATEPTTEEAPNESLVESQELREIFYEEPELKQAIQVLARYQVDVNKLTNDEVVEKYRRIIGAKKKVVQVLSRGRTLDGIDRLLSFVPTDYVGEFKGDNDADIARATGLGWKPFSHEGASIASVTGKGDSLVRLADQILMIMPEDEYIAMQMAKDERHARTRQGRELKKTAQRETAGFQSPVSPM